MIYKLLVIDDDEDMSRSIEHLYTNVVSDYQVKVVQTIREAETIVHKFRPDIIVIDGTTSKQPIMNNDITRLTSMWEYSRGKPKTILALEKRMIGKTLIESEADRVYEKPFKNHRIVETIRELLLPPVVEEEEKSKEEEKPTQKEESFQSVLPSRRQIYEQFQETEEKVDSIIKARDAEEEKQKRERWKQRKENR